MCCLRLFEDINSIFGEIGGWFFLKLKYVKYYVVENVLSIKWKIIVFVIIIRV